MRGYQSSDEALHVVLTQNFYDMFNDFAQRHRGVAFDRLAADQPLDAYALLIDGSKAIARSAISATTSEDINANRKMDGAEATSGLAYNSIDDVRLDQDIEPFDVIVSILQKRTLWDKIRRRKPKTKPVVAFKVDPSNPAQ